jgi:hypothetical protein
VKTASSDGEGAVEDQWPFEREIFKLSPAFPALPAIWGNATSAVTGVLVKHLDGKKGCIRRRYCIWNWTDIAFL